MRKLFTKEQEQYIRDNYKIMSDTEIANNLDGNFTQLQITGWRHNNNLKRERRITNIFSEEEIDYLKNNYDKMSYKEIGEKLGYSERQVRGKINNLGLSKLRKINEDYFEQIDTPLKAYFLGFIFADGWIVYKPEQRNYEFGIELQFQDKYVLEKINQELGGLNDIVYHEPQTKIINGVVAHSHGSYSLRVFSKKLVTDLMNQGIATNKTLKDIHPIIENKYFFDFLRRYIDGDGCYYISKNHCYLHITCASKKVLEYIQIRLSFFNISVSIYKEKDRKYRLICVNTQEMKKIVPLLYYDSNIFCLSRKIEKVQEYLIGSAA